jgi:small conductance mechanosensitive channel
VAHFYVAPEHDGQKVLDVLRDVALTSPFVQLDRPVAVVAAEQPWATHYQLKAYPLDGREQFAFLTDLTVRGKEALAEFTAAPLRLPIVAVPEQPAL